MLIHSRHPNPEGGMERPGARETSQYDSAPKSPKLSPKTAAFISQP